MDPISAPTSVPDPEWLLEQRAALPLSEPQALRLNRLRTRWDRDTRALRDALARASSQFDQSMAAASGRRLTVQEIQEWAAPLSELSRRLTSARRAWWSEAAPVLTASQRRRVEQAWAKRLSPK